VTLCVIPARGGSRRIPRKNVRLFAGRPMLAWAVDAARRSGVFERILVSTDDEDVATVAREAGATVPFRRPASLADDHTPTAPVIRHALDALADAGEEHALVACIYPTAPFLQPVTVRTALEALLESSAAFAVTVTTYPFPIQRALRLGSEGRVEMIVPEHRETRSQDLEEAWHDAGQLYWGRAEAYRAGIPLFDGGSTLGIPVPRSHVQDIDTPEDWDRAEAMFRALGLESSAGG
jgi:pseudaminic acid cytidylyltransferase